MKTKQEAIEKPSRKARKVRFQEKLNVIMIDERGVWHCGENLRLIRESVLATCQEAHRDRRIDLWNSTFQDPASFGLLCMWTTNSNSLRGLERFVCSQHRLRRTAEHQQRVQAVVSAQSYAGKVSVELAEISRAYSLSARTMAAQLGQADEFAVAADECKSRRMALIRDIVSGPPEVYPHMAATENERCSAIQKLNPSVESVPELPIRTLPSKSPSAA